MAIPTSYGYVYVTVYVTPTLQGIGDSSSGLVNGFLYVLFTKKVRRTVLINPCSSCTHSLRGKWRGRGGEREPILSRTKVGGGASLGTIFMQVAGGRVARRQLRDIHSKLTQ